MRQLPESHEQPVPNATRRTLLKAGVAGGVVLLLARWLVPSSRPGEARDGGVWTLDPSARAIVSAIAPVLLAGALPADAGDEVHTEVVAGVDRAVGGLPPASRKEIEQLFALLSFAPARCLLAGIWSPWPSASRDSIAAFLDSWRGSRFTLLRSAYGAMHQLVMAAWYGNTRSWPAIGYAGPPSLKVG